jgi:hypothetical protein
MTPERALVGTRSHSHLAFPPTPWPLPSVP